jgi:signal transduction histidine kinase
MPRLLRTTAFRLSLLYAAVFSLIASAALGFVFWSTISHIDEQIDARLRLETDVLMQLFRSRELPGLLETIQTRNRADNAGTFVYLLSGPDRDLLAGPLTSWPTDLDASRTYATFTREQLFEVKPRSKGHDELIRVLVTQLPGGYRMLVGHSVEDAKRLQSHTLTIVAVAITGIVGFALLGGALMGWDVLRRIDAVNRAAGEIVHGDLTRRLPISRRNDEFDALALRLNVMLERIEKLLVGMRQVTDHVAHDLRKPLNRLRSRLEVTLLEARNEDEYRGVMEDAIADADDLIGTFNALLSFAQLEADVDRDGRRQFSVSALCEDLAELYAAAAEDKHITFRSDIQSAITLNGVRGLVAQAFSNLLDNALKYAPRDGAIEFALQQDNDGAVVATVADNGPGIAPEDRERVLERFVRLEAARSTPGNGLGLSLVKAVTGLHDAQLVLRDNHPGLHVEVRFPNTLPQLTAPLGPH